MGLSRFWQQFERAIDSSKYHMSYFFPENLQQEVKREIKKRTRHTFHTLAHHIIIFLFFKYECVFKQKLAILSPLCLISLVLYHTRLKIKADWFLVFDALLMESIHLSNCFSHFYPLTKCIFANACMRLISPGRPVDSAAWSRAPPPGQRQWCELAAPSTLNSSYMPTEIKPPVMWIEKNNNKKKKERRPHISVNSFSQMHYSYAIICWELWGSQRCGSTTEGRGLFKCLWLLSPPHRETRGQRQLFNIPPPPGFHLHYQRF